MLIRKFSIQGYGDRTDDVIVRWSAIAFQIPYILIHKKHSCRFDQADDNYKWDNIETTDREHQF